MKLTSKEFQTIEAVNSCEARIENGADTIKAFNWLREELEQINKGVIIYDEDDLEKLNQDETVV